MYITPLLLIILLTITIGFLNLSNQKHNYESKFNIFIPSKSQLLRLVIIIICLCLGTVNSEGLLDSESDDNESDEEDSKKPNKKKTSVSSEEDSNEAESSTRRQRTINETIGEENQDLS
jgi:hypothetical protein